MSEFTINEDLLNRLETLEFHVKTLIDGPTECCSLPDLVQTQTEFPWGGEQYPQDVDDFLRYLDVCESHLDDVPMTSTVYKIKFGFRIAKTVINHYLEEALRSRLYQYMSSHVFHDKDLFAELIRNVEGFEQPACDELANYFSQFIHAAVILPDDTDRPHYVVGTKRYAKQPNYEISTFLGIVEDCRAWTEGMPVIAYTPARLLGYDKDNLCSEPAQPIWLKVFTHKTMTNDDYNDLIRNAVKAHLLIKTDGSQHDGTLQGILAAFENRFSEIPSWVRRDIKNFLEGTNPKRIVRLAAIIDYLNIWDVNALFDLNSYLHVYHQIHCQD